MLAFLALGSVVLAVTGGEALYTDMGHFGRFPIRIAWFGFVMPALVLNYFGQGALLLVEPQAIASPFYHLAPDWALIPMVVLATAATVIASQAVISGAFSVARQSIQMGLLPRMQIIHTSGMEEGQIYVPFTNWSLFLAVVALVLGFKNSSNLAAAYGIAVTGTMLIDTILVAFDWLLKSAEGGDIMAQVNTGIAYAKGSGVNADYLKAYKWLVVAQRRGAPNVNEYVLYLQKRLSPTDFNTASHQVDNWLASHK